MFTENPNKRYGPCYVGVSSYLRGHPVNIKTLCSGKYDDLYESSPTLFQIHCRIFSNKEEAISNMKKISDKSNDTYVLQMNCSPGKVREIIKSGKKKFSQLIINIINPVTEEEQSVDELLEKPIIFYC